MITTPQAGTGKARLLVAAVIAALALSITGCGSPGSTDGPEGYKNSNLSDDEKALLESGEPVVVTADPETGEILTVTPREK